MKRSTVIMVVLFAALLGLYFLQQRRPDREAPAPLSIDGYIGNVSEQEARSQAKDKPPPVTRIVLKRKDEAIVLDKQPSPPVEPAKPGESEKQPEKQPEQKWTASRTFKGKTTLAKAQAFRAQTMSETLQRSIRSSFSHPVKPEGLAEYGLDPEHAIDVEWTLPDRKVALRLGSVDKPQEGEPSTWVLDPARPEVAYQIAGRDLRASFDVTWSDLRDRSLLDLDLAEVNRLEIANPHDQRAPRIVAERPPLTEDKRKELADKKAERDADEGWTVVEPAGHAGGEIGAWLRAIGRLSANEFLDPAEVADKKLDTGLDDPKQAVRVTVHHAKDKQGQDKTVLVFGKQDESKPAKDWYARIEGRDEIYLVPAYGRDQIVQTLDQLRDRRLLGARKGKDAMALTLQGPDGKVQASRAGTTWTVTAPAMRTASDKVESFLGDLDTMKVDFDSAADPAKTGLEPAAWTLTLQFADETRTVRLGNEADGNLWGRVDVSTAAGVTPGPVFKLSTWNAGRLKKQAKDFADTRLLGVARDDVTAITLAPAGGEAVQLQKTDSGWTITAAGKTGPATAQAVDDLAGALVHLESTGTVAKKPAEAGLDTDFFAVRVSTKSKGELELRISRQKSGEDFLAGFGRRGKVEQVVTIGGVAAASIQKTSRDFAQ